MKKTILAVLSLSLVVLGTTAQDLEIGGSLRSRTSFGWETGQVHETRQILSLNLDYRGQDGYLHASPYATIDPRINPTDGLVNAPDLGVREAYIDLFFPSLDLRFGKQAIFWGQAEGAFITDMVSPQDLGSFILADFDEIRIGVPAIKALLYTGPLTFEAVWVQRFIPTVLPASGSLWRTNSMPNLGSAVVPSANLENSEIFGRVSFFSPLLTFDLMGGYAWDDLPAAQGSPASPTLMYHRSPMAGAVASTSLGPFVVRGEGAVAFDKHYTSLVPGMPPSLIPRTHQLIQGLGGLDWTLAGFNMSAQYLVQHIVDFQNNLMNQRETTHTGTFRVSHNFLDDRLSASIFAYLGFDPLDSLIRPKVSYSLEDGLEAAFSTDLFIGDTAGRFGAYADRSQGTFSLRWSF